MQPDYEKLPRPFAADAAPGSPHRDCRSGKGLPGAGGGGAGLRCLKCHVGPVFNGDKCILCGGCADVCPENCLRLVDVLAMRGDREIAGRLPRPLWPRAGGRGAGRHHQRRNPLHPLRPVRRAVSDRRHHDGKGGVGAGVKANPKPETRSPNSGMQDGCIMTESPNDKLQRRTFLTLTLGWCSALFALGASLAAAGRFLVPMCFTSPTAGSRR